jgi:hypothetical protein
MFQFRFYSSLPLSYLYLERIKVETKSPSPAAVARANAIKQRRSSVQLPINHRFDMPGRKKRSKSSVSRTGNRNADIDLSELIRKDTGSLTGTNPLVASNSVFGPEFDDDPSSGSSSDSSSDEPFSDHGDIADDPLTAAGRATNQRMMNESSDGFSCNPLEAGLIADYHAKVSDTTIEDDPSLDWKDRLIRVAGIPVTLKRAKQLVRSGHAHQCRFPPCGVSLEDWAMTKSRSDDFGTVGKASDFGYALKAALKGKLDPDFAAFLENQGNLSSEI